MNINQPAIAVDKDPLFQKVETILKEIIEAKSKGKVTILLEYIPKSGNMRIEVESSTQRSEHWVVPLV